MKATLTAHTSYGSGRYCWECPTLADARRQARSIIRRLQADRVVIERADGRREEVAS